MAYSHQTWSFGEAVTSTKLQTTEDNIRDHVHGRSSVAKTGVSFPSTDKTAGFTAVAGENGEMFHCDGTFTIDLTAAATLAAGWCIGVTNDGSGVITIDPNGAELIDGGATLSISANQSKLVYCNGLAFFTIGGGGALSWIARYTPSAAASVDITGFDSSLYDSYEIRIHNLMPVTDDVELWFRTSTNGGSSFDAGAADYRWTTSPNGGFSTDQSDVAIALVAYGVNASVASDANGGVSGVARLHLPSQAFNTWVEGIFGFFDGDAVTSVCHGAGQRMSAADVDAVQVLFESGNIASGTIDFYGVTKS